LCELHILGRKNDVPLVQDKEIRRQIAEVLRTSKKYFPEAADGTTLKEFDRMCGVLEERRKEAKAHIATHHRRELSIAYVYIWALAVTCLAISPQRGGKPPVPKNWLSKNGRPDPNWILQNLLLQIVNYSLAVVRLIEDGLEIPSRCVLRALNELCCQFLILSSERSKLSAYAKLENPAEAKKVWYELFAKKGSLWKSLTDLESRLGVPSFFVSELNSYRDYVNTFFSQSVHHSFASAVICSYVGDFSSEENLHFSLFGKASPTSDTTLYELNTILIYTLLMFLNILAEVHEFKAPLEDELWREVFLFSTCVRKVARAEPQAEDKPVSS
jgi:hypothetical protein